MIKKLVSWMIWGLIGAVIVVFLFANRGPVAISLDPFSVNAPAIVSPALPLWVWLMLFLLAGFGLGATGMWLSGKTKREQMRRDKRRIKDLTRENETLAARSTGEAPLIVADG